MLSKKRIYQHLPPFLDFIGQHWFKPQKILTILLFYDKIKKITVLEIRK